jgi:hypothetical protein
MSADIDRLARRVLADPARRGKGFIGYHWINNGSEGAKPPWSKTRWCSAEIVGTLMRTHN